MGCECKTMNKRQWLIQHISHRRADQAQEFTTELYNDFDEAKDGFYELVGEEVEDTSVFDDMFAEFDPEIEGELVAWSVVTRQYIHTFRFQAIKAQ